MFTKEMDEEYGLLLSSDQKNRKKKKYFPDYYIKRNYLVERAFNIAKKYYFGLLSWEEDQSIKQTCCWKLDFWKIRGYSEEEAVEVVKIKQEQNSAKRTEESILKSSWRRKEYWIERGYTEKEAVEQISKKQKTFSLDICIEKYGEEEGYLVWKTRQEKWKKSLNKNNDMEVVNSKKDSSSFEWALRKCDGDYELAKKIYEERSLKKDSSSFEWALRKCDGDYELAQNLYSKRHNRKLVNLKWYSKESIKFLQELYNYCIALGMYSTEIFWKENEFVLRRGRFGFYSYDFTLISLNMIIEYHGKAFHPKNIDEEWSHPFGKSTKEECLEYDRQKKEFAKNNGFLYYEVWSDETQGFLENMKLIIGEKYYEKIGCEI